MDSAREAAEREYPPMDCSGTPFRDGGELLREAFVKGYNSAKAEASAAAACKHCNGTGTDAGETSRPCASCGGVGTDYTRATVEIAVSEDERLREKAIHLWGDWATNGWDRPDDDLEIEFKLTPEEQRRGLAHGERLKEAADDA